MRNKAYLRYIILALSLAMTALGAARREHLEVLGKAARICLECIGIG